MPGAIAKFDDTGAAFEDSLKVTDLLCAGVPIAEVARRQGCSVDEVEKALVRITGGISPAIKERHTRVIYGRMERIHRANYVKALKGDYNATVSCLRANEFVARLLGLFPPPNVQSPLDDAHDIETSTDKIRAAIDRVRGRAARQIDGEVIADAETPACD